MEFIRGLHNLRERHFGSVITIGNFDGLHLGHLELLKQLNKKSKQYDLPSCVVLFEPQPNEFFSVTNITPRLMKLREKIVGIAKQDIDRILCIRFNTEFSKMTAQQFTEDILMKHLGAKFVLVGDDFRFGYQRQGNFDLLQEFGNKYGFQAECMPTLLVNGGRVSSTKIREFLAQGNMEKTAELLARPYTMMGRVIHGDKRGRSIGFPTANIQLHRKAVPIRGVFVVRVHGLGKKAIQGVANIGTRPTVLGSRILLEVHLFDFDRMIYGEHVEVEFMHKLRDEQRFDSFDDLVRRIQQDVEEAKHYFRTT